MQAKPVARPAVGTQVENAAASGTTFVLFGGIAQGFAIPPFEFRRMMAEVPATKIYVRDVAQGWYQHAVQGRQADTRRLFQGLPDVDRRLAGQRLVFIGNSMGGFAALMFGALLRADRVIAFTPQTFVDPLRKLRHNDRRWWRQMLPMYARHGLMRWSYDLRNPLAASARPAKATVYYGTALALDRQHAERIGDSPGVTLAPIEGEGHDAVKHLRDKGALHSLLLEAAGGSTPAPPPYGIRAGRS